MPPAPFARDIAALGVAYWEDVTHEDGGMLKYTHFVARVGLKDGKDVDDRVRKQYHNLKAHVHKLRGTGEWQPDWEREVDLVKLHVSTKTMQIAREVSKLQEVDFLGLPIIDW